MRGVGTGRAPTYIYAAYDRPFHSRGELSRFNLQSELSAIGPLRVPPRLQRSPPLREGRPIAEFSFSGPDGKVQKVPPPRLTWTDDG